MASRRLCSIYLCLFAAIIPGFRSQSASVGQNIYEALTKLNCSQFKAIIEAADRQNFYKSPAPLTVFVFDNDAYNRLPPYMVNNLYDRSSANNAGANEYVSSFTMNGVIETSSFSEATPYKTLSVRSRKLFLNRQQLLQGNTASGLPGPTKYFANGAIIARPNVQAGQHVIHILDRVLPMPLSVNVLAYVSGYNPDQRLYNFFELFMKQLSIAPQEDQINNYDRQVHLVLSNLDQPVTFFLPTDQAISRIPVGQRNQLVADSRKLLRIITLHIVPKKALYTSLVNHNQQFSTQYNSGRVVFRKNFDREAVYVTGALSGGNTVTARINSANITALNGVVHHIDQVLGFVYKTVFEEISLDKETQNFEQLINRGRNDLKQNIMAPSGVYVFVPTNEAMIALQSRFDNYINNASLINMILEMSVLQPDQRVSLTDHSGGYESFIVAKSRFSNSQWIKIYSAGNDTWVEGGYVKARVVKPDIGCTNGAVHQIDAVFGVPTRDLPYTIYCEDWLESTYIQLHFVGLDNYMRDTQLVSNQACKTRANRASTSVPNSPTGNNNNRGSSSSSDSANSYELYRDLCGDTVHRCEFTFFVPNGTAIDAFARTTYGRAIMEEPKRWRWILRRLLTFREVIYLDRLAPGQQRVMYSDNGDEILIRTDSRSSIPSSRRTAYINFEGIQAKVIHSDIGATNGVMHIIDSVLFVPDDLTRSVDPAPKDVPDDSNGSVDPAPKDVPDDSNGSVDPAPKDVPDDSNGSVDSAPKATHHSLLLLVAHLILVFWVLAER